MCYMSGVSAINHSLLVENLSHLNEEKHLLSKEKAMLLSGIWILLGKRSGITEKLISTTEGSRIYVSPFNPIRSPISLLFFISIWKKIFPTLHFQQSHQLELRSDGCSRKFPFLSFSLTEQLRNFCFAKNVWLIQGNHCVCAWNLRWRKLIILPLFW